jgi:hypothetical protein
MANKHSEDHMSVHHEDSANSRGPPFSRDPVTRHLFPNTDVIDSTTPIIIPTIATSAPVTTAIIGVPTCIADIRMANNTPQGGGQPLRTPQVEIAAQRPSTGNIIPPQTLQPIPPYSSNCYTQFHTLYYPQYPGYEANILVTPFFFDILPKLSLHICQFHLACRLVPQTHSIFQQKLTLLQLRNNHNH